MTTDDDAGLETTVPNVSRWDQEGAEYVHLNEEWVARCARRMGELHPEVGEERSRVVAQWLSLNETIRALAPEKAADDVVVP